MAETESVVQADDISQLFGRSDKQKEVHVKEARAVQELAADPDEDASASTGAAASRDEETCDLRDGLRERSGVALALAEPVMQKPTLATSMPISNDVGHGFDLDAGCWAAPPSPLSAGEKRVLINHHFVPNAKFNSQAVPTPVAFGQLREVSLFFANSPKRQLHLESVINDTPAESINESRKKKLVSLCRTRWVQWHTALVTFADLFSAVVDTIEDTAGDHAHWNADMWGKSSSLLRVITDLSFLATFCYTVKHYGIPAVPVCWFAGESTGCMPRLQANCHHQEYSRGCPC